VKLVSDEVRSRSWAAFESANAARFAHRAIWRGAVASGTGLAGGFRSNDH
jgi:hypothetical protein